MNAREAAPSGPGARTRVAPGRARLRPLPGLRVLHLRGEQVDHLVRQHASQGDSDQALGVERARHCRKLEAERLRHARQVDPDRRDGSLGARCCRGHPGPLRHPTSASARPAARRRRSRRWAATVATTGRARPGTAARRARDASPFASSERAGQRRFPRRAAGWEPRADWPPRGAG